MAKRITLTDVDQRKYDALREAIEAALATAERRPALARKLFVLAAKHRNKGRKAAMRRYPFAGKCEISGWTIPRKDAALDELDPTKGYEGPLRWVCQKANGDGTASCGQC